MSSTLNLPSYFQNCLTQANLALDISIQNKILAYVDLLIQWNRAYNLTAIREPQEIITKHIMDSLTIVHFIGCDRILDIGSGAGFPGILIALLKPDSNITLLDSNGKKTRFLIHVKATLNLENVEIVNTRVEAYVPTALFDCIVSRAFATIAKTLLLAEHLCKLEGSFLLMKGVYPAEEIAEMPTTFSLTAAHRLTVPDIDAERHLICIQKSK